MTYTIGLDLDGVCYEWERTARYMLRRRFAARGESIPQALVEKSTSWASIQDAIDPEDWKWLWSEGVKLGLFRYGHVQRGGIEGAQKLAAMGDVVIVTSRPKQAIHDTTAWLNFHFDKVPYMGLHVLSHDQPKSGIIPQPNVYIDDAVHNLDELVVNTPRHTRVVLFDQPWNQVGLAPETLAEEGTKWLRAYGWDHTVELVASTKEGRW